MARLMAEGYVKMTAPQKPEPLKDKLHGNPALYMRFFYFHDDVAAAVELLSDHLKDFYKVIGTRIWLMNADEICYEIENYCQQKIRNDFPDVVEKK